jgi:hypothetical protein
LCRSTIWISTTWFSTFNIAPIFSPIISAIFGRKSYKITTSEDGRALLVIYVITADIVGSSCKNGTTAIGKTPFSKTTFVKTTFGKKPENDVW